MITCLCGHLATSHHPESPGNGGCSECHCGGYIATPPFSDPINHPPHYTAHPSGVECIDITEHMNFCVGNAIKYLWRADHKNGLEDLKKAVWYINREIERREKLHD